jgi:hypothetical protein
VVQSSPSELRTIFPHTAQYSCSQHRQYEQHAPLRHAGHGQLSRDHTTQPHG